MDFNKFFDVFNKVDNTINTVNRMGQTADRVQYQAQNAKSAGKWKWIILGVIIVAAVFYVIFQ